jgi:hypothetical protein
MKENRFLPTPTDLIVGLFIVVVLILLSFVYLPRP